MAPGLLGVTPQEDGKARGEGLSSSKICPSACATLAHTQAGIYLCFIDPNYDLQPL